MRYFNEKSKKNKKTVPKTDLYKNTNFVNRIDKYFSNKDKKQINNNEKVLYSIDYKKPEETYFFNQEIHSYLFQNDFNDNVKIDLKNSFYENTFNIIPSKDVWLKIKGNYTIDLKYGIGKRVYISDNYLESLNGKKRSNFLFENTESYLFLKGLNFFQTFSFEIEGLVTDEFNAKVFSDTSSSIDSVNYKAEWRPKKVPTIKYIKIENKENTFDKVNIYAENNNTSDGGLKDVFSIKARQELFNFNLDTFFNLSFNKRETLEFSGFSREEIITVKDSEFFKRRFFKLYTENAYLIDKIEIFEETYNYNYDMEIITPYKNSYGEWLSVTNRFKRIEENSFNFDRKNKVLDIGFEANKKVILFFTENSKAVSSSGVYNRENVKYTTLTNISPSSIKGVNGEIYKNFAVLSDPLCENEKNPFELKNYYPLAENIDTLTIETSLVFNNDSEIENENTHKTLNDGEFNTTGRFGFNYKNGYMFFYDSEPFLKSGAKIKNEDIYKLPVSVIKENTDKYSKYKIVYKYKTSKNSFYKLKNNVVEGSVSITVNAIHLKESDYNVDYKNGIVTLENQFLIKQNDKVIISYSYSENSSTGFKYNVGSRLSYNFDKKNELGFGVIYRGNIDSGKTVYVNSSPSANLLLITDFSFDLPYLITKENNNFNFTVGGGYAYSIYDANTRNNASVFDIAENENILTLSKNENIDLFLTQNPLLENEGYNLGYLYFIDLKDYNNVLNTKWRDLSYENINKIKKENPEQIKDFSVKSGPYIAKNAGEKLYGENTKTDALIFDYNFTEKNNYVSVVNGFNKVQGIDASEYNEIEIVASLTALDNDTTSEKYTDPKKINILLELGSPTEDFDGDNIFDSEKNEYDLGFNFNYKENTIYERRTFLGAGVKGSSRFKVEEGNSRLDKEDLNNDNISYSSDDTVVFPSKDTVDFFNENLNTLEVPTLNYYNQNKNYYENTFYKTEYIGDNFFKINIKIKNNLDSRTKELLRKSFALRFTLFGKEKTSGRLTVSRVHFKKNANENIYLDGKKPTVNNNFFVTTINTSYNDRLKLGSGKRIVDDKDWFKIYTSLHGKLDLNDRKLLKESALRFEYNLNGITYSPENEDNTKEALIFIKRYQEKYDFSLYKEISFFIYKELTSENSQEYFLFGFGESEEKYISVKIPFVFFDREEKLKGADNIDVTTAWNKVTVFLDKNGVSHISVNNSEKIKIGEAFYIDSKTFFAESESKGKVNLENINVFVFGAGVKENYKARGAFWINELYVNDDKKVKGHAWNIESLINYKNIDINGFSVLSNFNVSYSHKYIGLGFAKLNSKPSDKEISLDSISISSMFIENMVSSSFVFSYEESFYDKSFNKDNFKENVNKESHLGYNSFVFNLSFNSPNKYIPNLSHSYAERYDTKNYMFLDNQNNYVLKNSAVFTKVSEIKEDYNITNIFSLENVNLKQSFFIQGVIEKIYSSSFYNIECDNLKIKNYFAVTKKEIEKSEEKYKKYSLSNYSDDGRYILKRKDAINLSLEITNILYLDFSLFRDLSFYTYYKNTNEDFFNKKYDSGYLNTFETIFNYKNIVGGIGEEKNKNHFVNEKYYNVRGVLSTGHIKFLGEIYLEVFYIYKENDFEYNAVKDFNNDNNKNKEINNLKTITSDFKNIFSKTAASISFDLFSFNKSTSKNEEQIFHMPVSFYRELSLFENDVFNNKSFFLTRHFNKSSQILFKMPFYYSEIPFVSFIKEAFPSAFKDSMKRHSSSDEVENIYSKLIDNSFAASYYSDILFENGYIFDFVFKYFDNINFILPNKLRYEYRQKTLKENSFNFYQYEYIYIFVKHSLDLIYIIDNFFSALNPDENNNIFNDLKYTRLSYEIGYKKNMRYNEKVAEESFIISLFLNHPSKNFETVFNFSYEFISSKEYANYEEGKTLYMGIGRYKKNNFGQYENIYNSFLENYIPVSLSKNEHIISIDLRFNFYQVINKGFFIDLIKSQINIIHSLSISVPFFKFGKFDDKIVFYFDNTSHTSSSMFDFKNMNIVFDNLEEFLFIKPSYIFTLTSSKYFSVNTFLNIPLVFTKFYKTSYEYKSMKRFDIKAAFEIGFSLSLSY